jgi:hypothetical protein
MAGDEAIRALFGHGGISLHTIHRAQLCHLSAIQLGISNTIATQKSIGVPDAAGNQVLGKIHRPTGEKNWLGLWLLKQELEAKCVEYRIIWKISHCGSTAPPNRWDAHADSPYITRVNFNPLEQLGHQNKTSNHPPCLN